MTYLIILNTIVNTTVFIQSSSVVESPDLLRLAASKIYYFDQKITFDKKESILTLKTCVVFQLRLWVSGPDYRSGLYKSNTIKYQTLSQLVTFATKTVTISVENVKKEGEASSTHAKIMGQVK